MSAFFKNPPLARNSCITGFVLAGIALPLTATAQDDWQCGPSPSDSRLTVEDSILAARYAPIYWFAPGERYFPTLPFFTAFDGIDNNGDGSVDFGNPFEIAPSWEFLNGRYLDRGESDAEKIGRSAIFFRVCDLTAEDIADIWRYLRSDEQAWHRFDIDADILARLRRKDRINDQGVLERGTEFRVIQYYGFYLRDYGLQGHHYDSELAYVIVPKDEELARQFRVVVGGGHTDRIPNNVLVLSGALAARQAGLDARPSILVELGDHSSSPDLPPYGEFSPGLDANWHNHDLWGTRDVQASSGLGAMGPYRAWMTFPRRPEVAVRLFPPVVHDTALRRMTQIQLESDQEVARYSLLPVEPFVDLYDLVAGTDSVPTPAQIREIESAMARVVELTHRGWSDEGSGTAFAIEFAGFDNLDQSQKRAAVTEMKKWLLPVNVVANHYPWETDHYTKVPSRIFKHHLFRPVFTAMSFPLDYLRQLNFAVTWHPGTVLLQVGWDVAAFWLPIRIEGYLSVQGGVYMRCSGLVTPCFGATSPAFSVVHTAHYNRLMSWYIRGSWIPKKKEVDGQPDQSDWLIGGGLALAPSKIVRLRLGLVTDLRHTSPLLGSTVFEAQLVIHPFHRRGVPTEFDPRLVLSGR